MSGSRRENRAQVRRDRHDRIPLGALYEDDSSSISANGVSASAKTRLINDGDTVPLLSSDGKF